MSGPDNISKKCCYALKALFELALRDNPAPVKIRRIASAQKIPKRFLEIILSELKHGNFVLSKRGNEGGYMLAKPANNITVGDVISFVEGRSKQKIITDLTTQQARGEYVFSRLWEKASQAIANIYNNVTLADLVEQERMMRKDFVLNYAI
ncbi:RrF2 family transcriptional regulator [Planctomycetota bacterium]